ncbi:hypothetical protein AAL_08281 [Moelleriella libera RCEF 2490]|uniref:CHAT domain-containing protein n=1 Tax=Moelleriella libera RCEF 2490 TaxID=1081109 RepID=A0A167VNF0_9HYPO|nr:hypothetical protein AAL_08281 [Moelleriella libera RCEF 2490]
MHDADPERPEHQLSEHRSSVRRSLAVETEMLRKVKGFENFQLPFTEDQMKRLAVEGPIIVINVSEIRCDALIVSIDEIKIVELPYLKEDNLQQKMDPLETLGNEDRRSAMLKEESSAGTGGAAILDALEWSWRVAVRPILDETPLTPSKRVWWITTGKAGRAPFHAAGCHSPGSTEKTLSRVTSSYISSFKALQYARDKKSSLATPRRDILLVTMGHNPPPHRNLNVSAEEKALYDVFRENPITQKSCFTHLRQWNRDSVLDRLRCHSFAHFACHGSSFNFDPSQGGLLLAKTESKVAMLTVEDIKRYTLEAGVIAYLLAYLTAE